MVQGHPALWRLFQEPGKHTVDSICSFIETSMLTGDKSPKRSEDLQDLNFSTCCVLPGAPGPGKGIQKHAPWLWVAASLSITSSTGSWLNPTLNVFSLSHVYFLCVLLAQLITACSAAMFILINPRNANSRVTQQACRSHIFLLSARKQNPFKNNIYGWQASGWGTLQSSVSKDVINKVIWEFSWAVSPKCKICVPLALATVSQENGHQLNLMEKMLLRLWNQKQSNYPFIRKWWTTEHICIIIFMLSQKEVLRLGLK